MSELPFVSVIMPIRNEANTIVRALGAVLDQRYPRERMEVLVVDGLSDDGTHAVVQRATYDRRVRLFDNPRLSAAAALNIGLAHARGEIIVRVDGHTIVAPDYLVACVEALQRSAADNVGGLMRPVGGTSWGQAAALATSSPFGVGNSRFHYDGAEQWADTVYLGAYRRSVFERIGGWDEGLERNQDDELNMRLRAAGGRILLAPSIRSAYRCRDTLGGLWRQYFGYGMWKVPVLLRHPEAAHVRHFAPAALVLALGGGALLAPFARRVRPFWLALSALYVLALAVATLLAWHRKDSGEEGDNERSWRGGDLGPLDGSAARTPTVAPRSLWLRLPLAFACLHWAYGCGFLVGVVRSCAGAINHRRGAENIELDKRDGGYSDI